MFLLEQNPFQLPFTRIAQAVNDELAHTSPLRRKIFETLHKHMEMRYQKGYLDSILGA